MNKRRFRIYFWTISCILSMAIFGSIVIINDRVFSYDTNIAHPNIITESAKIYNKSSQNKLNIQQISWMEQGSINEDTPLRWVNHFYDPINNKGYHGKYSTAKSWSKDSTRQRNYALGDNTWQRAISDYQAGNYEQAFEGLGHVLHLIADMAVPAHTRDDSHPMGDSYEQYVKNNWDSIKNRLDLNLNLDNFKINKLEEPFDKLARYSNGNFYSNDTINNNTYTIPNLKSTIEKDNYLYLNDIKLVFLEKTIFGNDYTTYFLDNNVLNSYAQHLLPQAIGYSAGVIDLFFREVNKGTDYKITDSRTSIWGYLNQGVGSVVSGLGKLWDKSDEIKNLAVNPVRSESAPTLSDGNAQNNIQDTHSNIQDNIQNTSNNIQTEDDTLNNIQDTGNNIQDNTQDNEQDTSNNIQIEDDTQNIEHETDSDILTENNIIEDGDDDPFVAPIVYSGGGTQNNIQDTSSNIQTEDDTQNMEQDTQDTDDDTQTDQTSSSTPTSTSTIQTPTSTPLSTTQTPTSTPDPTPTTTIITTTTPLSILATLSSFIKLNEVVNNPVSGDEWVELYNSGNETINLTDWYICDSRLSGCKKITGEINPNQWLVVDLETSRFLNNDGDSVILFDSADQEMDKVIYGNILGTPDKGQSLARNNDGYDTDSNADWSITNQITKGFANIIILDDVNEPKVTTTTLPILPTPVVSNIFTSLMFTTSTNLVIEGTCSTSTEEILVYWSDKKKNIEDDKNLSDYLIATTSKTTTSTWQYEPTLKNGNNYYGFVAKAKGYRNSSSTYPVGLIFDILPPPVPNIKTSVSSTRIIVQLEGKDEFALYTYYDLQKSIDKINWQDVAINTSTSEFIIDGNYGDEYYFRSRASDSLGNVSEWSDKNNIPVPVLIDFSHEVVINEIAWAGVPNYSYRGWIELYNTTSSSIDISNWKIVMDGNALSIKSRPNSIIEPFGYYLVERLDDNTIRDINADLIYQGDGFSNNGNRLYLIDNNGEYIDEVNCSDGWFAGGGAHNATMKRINSNASGNDKNNWTASIGFRVLGRGYSSEYVYGSPRQVNHGFLNLNFAQIEDERILSPANNPYILQYYDVPVDKKLIVQPGVVIKSYYKDARIVVDGSLEAVGNSSSTIIFTSSRDQSFHNVNLDKDVASWGGEAQSRDWQGLWFKAGSVGVIDNVEFRYSGGNFRLAPALPTNYSQSIRAEGANLLISNTVFNQGGEYFVYLQNSSTTLDSIQFNNADVPVKADEGVLKMDTIEFKNLSSDRGVLETNNIWPDISNFTFVSTTNQLISFDKVEFNDETITLGPDLDYSFKQLVVGSTATLNIQSGTTIHLPMYSIIDINGKLNSNGTAERPINIGTAKGWGYMYFNGASGVLRHTNIYGGGGLAEYKDTAIELIDSDFDCRNCRIWNFRSPGNGIKAFNSSVSLVDSEIGMDVKWPDPYGWYASYSTGVRMDGGSLFLDNVNFANLNYGVFKTAKTTGNQPDIITQNMTPSNYINVFKPYIW